MNRLAPVEARVNVPKTLLEFVQGVRGLSVRLLFKVGRGSAAISARSGAAKRSVTGLRAV
ncbi:MAG TPA: hypothetical protein VEJ84_00650 [Acidimicrobiales bacterium]|nr:hypothetical protein [Acidimicrobiales bacterium]